MHNKHNDNELEMSRFGEYMLKSRVVAEKYAPYYARKERFDRWQMTLFGEGKPEA